MCGRVFTYLAYVLLAYWEKRERGVWSLGLSLSLSLLVRDADGEAVHLPLEMVSGR